MKLRSIILGTAVLAAAFAAGAPAAMAGTGLTIQPIKVSQTLTPGSSASGKILLTNASEDDVAVDVSVQDFVPTAGTETFQFVGRAPGVTSVRDWVTIAAPLHFTFHKGESREIPYTISAPRDAQPGSHFGALFFKATRVADLEASIKVGTQVGVLVFVTIPGNYQQKGTVTGFSSPAFVQGGPVPFRLDFHNTGTVYFEPKGTIDVSNMFGSKIASVPIEGYAVLPTGEKEMNFSWNASGLLLGRYAATASVYDSAGSLIATSTAAFYAFPLWYLVGFIAAIAVIYYGIRFLRSRVQFSVKMK